MRRRSLYLLLAGACALLQACGSGGSSPNPPAPPQSQIVITSPADGTTLTSLPATISVSFTNGADSVSMRALLDGVDISSQFSAADSNGIRQAQVDRPALNLGKNQLQITSGAVRASASFIVALGGGGLGSSAGLPLLVPIRTRVLTGDGSSGTDYNIVLYEDPNNPNTATMIQAPPPPPDTPADQGFQIVFLRRSDLAVISNVVVPNVVPIIDGQAESSLLFATLSVNNPPSGCGNVGCLLIMQSLKTLGYTPCSVPQYPQDCQTFTELFASMGASARWLWANGDTTQIAYSFIENTSGGSPLDSMVQAGNYFERLTCSGSNSASNPRFCDSLGPYPGSLGFPSTSGTAPSNATPAQIGNMAGALIRDNFYNYTYTQSAPSVAFSSYYDSQNISHNFTINGNSYWSGFAQGSGPGGIHVVILDRTTLSLKQNQWWLAQPDASEIQSVFNFLSDPAYNTYGNLIFLAAFGNTSYTTTPMTVATANRARWYQLAQMVGFLGGTEQVFYLVNNQEHSPPPQIDDYTLVGAFIDNRNTGLQNTYYKEMSSVISRETEAFPLNSDMEGLLKMDHQGFYSPGPVGHNLGLASVAIADAVSASLVSPTPWPFPGPDPAKSQVAYTWISQQLCCDDIRSAYVNLNVSPNTWLTLLQQLAYSSTLLPNSDEEDFNDMKQQLATEFEYVSAVRLLQTNVTSLYQQQQSNVPLLLQAAQDQVTQNLQIDLKTSAKSASWLTILGDTLGAAGLIAPLAGGPVGGPLATAISFATFAVHEAAEHSNTPAGTSLEAQENLEVTAGTLASSAASEYAQSLVTLGNQFDRVVTDWGRLKTVGAPLQAGQLPWDSNAAGYLLQAYDRTIQREFYTKLIQSNAQVIYYPYVTDQSYIGDTGYGSGNECFYEQQNVDPYWQLPSVSLLFYPSGAPNTDTNNGNRCCAYPHDYDWAIWALVYSQNNSDDCPMSDTQPSTFGLFEPLDPNNPDTLGTYRLWFYTRKGYVINTNNNTVPCYDDC